MAFLDDLVQNLTGLQARQAEPPRKKLPVRDGLTFNRQLPREDFTLADRLDRMGVPQAKVDDRRNILPLMQGLSSARTPQRGLAEDSELTQGSINGRFADAGEVAMQTPLSSRTGNRPNIYIDNTRPELTMAPQVPQRRRLDIGFGPF